jgi:polyisoprenoid-binding protein YceI
MKMKKTILVPLIFAATLSASAQKKTTTAAVITFDASTALDNLPKAENKTVVAAIDLDKNTVQFEAAVKNFSFSNPKMQEHFNQKSWMNSDEYPKASFSGVITNPKTVTLKKDGTYSVTVEGDLTIKGKTQKITTPATLVIAGSAVKATASFSILLADFDIDGPPVSAGKVSREPKITVVAEFH